VQGQAAELAMFLCLPAALALCASALPLVSAIFEAGRFNARDAHYTALTLSIVALGLPAYVLVKVLTPGFYARRDTATPVKTAIAVLIVNVALNFALIPPFGIGGLAAAVAISSWLNCLILYVILHRRGFFRIERWLASRIMRQLIAAAAMVAALILIRMALSGWFVGSFGQRVFGLAAIVGGGMLVYFPLAWILGGTDKEGFKSMLRRRRPYTDAG
jgi:putative peptidoglycan lipid II flippase